MQTANQNTAQNPGQTTAGQTGTVSQVAWQFVVQYYTYVNSKPDQLHRFYSKNSHYLHGVEGEETSVLQGQAAIHKKFVEIGFKGCKVFIHSVDAHPSANNGILVHVIGEMSNNNEPWKKFVQAFFLAEQQNGYFVMNDNFRYLKEETFADEDEEGLEGQESGDLSGALGQGQIPHNQTAPPMQEQTQPSYVGAQTNGYLHNDQAYAPIAVVPHPAPPSHAAAPAPVETPAQPVAPISVEPAVEEIPTSVPEPAPVAVPEVVAPVKEQPVTPPVAKLTTPAPPSPATASRKTPSPAPPAAAPASEPSTGQPSSLAPPPSAPASVSAPSTVPQTQPPSATPTATPATPAAVPSQPAQPPQPGAPPAPKTWAGMAAANSARWGHNVAQEVKGVSASVPQQQQSHAAPAAQPPRERQAGGPTSGGAAANASAGGDPALQPGGVGPKNIPPKEQHPLYAQALTVTTPLCFIKGVTENIPQQALEQVLSSRFGPIKECEVVRSKACAFLEFKSVDSAKRAIIASLHLSSGGDGGVKLDEEKYGSPARVIVETRKERGDRPAPRPRGGTPIPAGEGRSAGDKGTGASGGPAQQGQGNYRGGRGGGNVRGRGDGGRGDSGRGGKA